MSGLQYILEDLILFTDVSHVVRESLASFALLCLADSTGTNKSIEGVVREMLLAEFLAVLIRDN